MSLIVSPRPRRGLVLLVVLCAGVLACGEGEPSDAAPDPVGWETDDLTAVSIPTSRLALVVGRSGAIYRTADAGASWARVHLEPDVALHDVSFADDRHAWAVGDGRLLSTRDGGLSWAAQPLPAGRERARLRAVQALDAMRAVAVGLGGARLETADGGQTWRDRSEAATPRTETSPERAAAGSLEPAGPTRPSIGADLHGLHCLGGDEPGCAAVGAPGASARSADGGVRWLAAPVEPPVGFAAISMARGQVELSAEDRARVEQLAAALRERPRQRVRLEAVASLSEIEEIGRERDPEALFEVLEARLLDLRSVLEERGVSPVRIEPVGSPPWGYEEFLDDDPELLERYFAARRAARAGLRVRVPEDRRLFDVRLGVARAESVGVGVAVGERGAVWRTLDGGAHWAAAREVAPHDLHAVAELPTGLLAVGAQGTLRQSSDGGRAWSELPAGSHPIRFGALYDVGVSPEGRLGLIVGQHGLLWRAEADGGGWSDLRVASDPKRAAPAARAAGPLDSAPQGRQAPGR